MPDEENTVYVVMSNPPEVRASHPIEAWTDESLAERRTEQISMAYVSEVRLDKENPRYGDD